MSARDAGARLTAQLPSVPQLRFLTAGESHGEALVGIVEGCPAGVPMSRADVDAQLARRWIGFGRGGRRKIERDEVEIISGVRFGRTIASPIAMRLANAAYERDRAGWPDVMAVEGSGEGIEPVTLPRPGHADQAGMRKYRFATPDGRPDGRPVIERASARETAMRTACCTVARQLLRQLGIQVGSHVIRIGAIAYRGPQEWAGRSSQLLGAGGAERLAGAADESDVRVLDPDVAGMMRDHIEATRAAGDSLGGMYEVVVTGVPPGLGSYVHWDRRLDGRLARAILSIQAQKAVEIGDGFAGSFRPGSAVHDPIVSGGSEGLTRASNHAGGLEGGVSNGMPIVVRGVMKPIPTLIRPLETVDMATGEARPTRYERSDVTSVPAASVVAEATVAFEIANAVLDKFGGDSLEELTERVDAWRGST